MLPYILPFALYIGLSMLGAQFENGMYFMYPVKTIAVAASLIYFRKSYVELNKKLTVSLFLISAFVGLVVFIIWVAPEGLIPTLGVSEFNPYVFENQNWTYFSIAFRLIGAALVVPVFEELFWRSFLIRWIVDQDFKKIPLGKFTWLSFVLTIIFFGFEHHRWAVGIAAGLIYNGLLYWRKDLWACIIAHGITNLALGIYVLITQQWSFW